MSTSIRQAEGKAKPEADSGSRHTRTAAEWLSLGLSLAIIGALLGLLIFAHLRRSGEPAIVVVRPRLEAVRAMDGTYSLPVEVTNEGGATAASLEIDLTLHGVGESETATLSIDYLADGEAVQGHVRFQQDPSAGKLVVTSSYLEP